jgi:hypothetical protein
MKKRKEPKVTEPFKTTIAIDPETFVRVKSKMTEIQCCGKWTPSLGSFSEPCIEAALNKLGDRVPRDRDELVAMLNEGGSK